MSTVFWFVVGWIVGWTSAMVVFWTFGLLLCTAYFVGLLFSRPALARIALPLHLSILAVGLLLCFGDYHLVTWLASSFKGAKEGMMTGFLIPGLFCLPVIPRMLAGAMKDLGI